jgi:hypothetical protein
MRNPRLTLSSDGKIRAITPKFLHFGGQDRKNDQQPIELSLASRGEKPILKGRSFSCPVRAF